MEAHYKDCTYPYGDEWLSLSPVNTFCNSVVYRLRPDYEPRRYWFLPPERAAERGAKHITSMTTDGNAPDHDMWLEVTAKYADYLRNKPEGDWELKMLGVGDVFLTYPLRITIIATCNMKFIGPEDLGYRWCKPKVDIAAMRKAVADARDKWLAAGAEYRDLDKKLGKALEAQQ
jgi:hypothetical protein